MSLKSTNILFFIFLICIGGYYFLSSLRFLRNEDIDFFLNPGFFPLILSSILLILIIVSIIQTIIKSDKGEKFPSQNIKSVVGIFSLAVIYILLWDGYSNLFYLFTFFFFLSVSLILARVEKKNITSLLLRNGIVALGLTSIVYVVFDLLFSLPLT